MTQFKSEGKLLQTVLSSLEYLAKIEIKKSDDSMENDYELMVRLMKSQARLLIDFINNVSNNVKKEVKFIGKKA